MPDKRQINISVPDVVHARLEKMAGAARMPLSTYAAQLFIAAYSSKVKPPTGDRDLDASVARVAILYAEKRDTAAIADAVGLSEACIVRVIDAWRDEVGLRSVA